LGTLHSTDPSVVALVENLTHPVAGKRKEFFEGLLHPLVDAEEEGLMIFRLEGLNVDGKNFLQELRNVSRLPPIADGYDESSLVQSFFAN